MCIRSMWLLLTYVSSKTRAPALPFLEHRGVAFQQESFPVQAVQPVTSG